MISRRRNNRIPNLIINIQRLEFFVFKFVNQVVSNLACHRYPILKSFIPKLDRGKLASNQFKPPQTSLSIPLSSPNSFKQEILSKISFKPSQTTSNHLKPRQTLSNHVKPRQTLSSTLETRRKKDEIIDIVSPSSRVPAAHAHQRPTRANSRQREPVIYVWRSATRLAGGRNKNLAGFIQSVYRSRNASWIKT